MVGIIQLEKRDLKVISVPSKSHMCCSIFPQGLTNKNCNEQSHSHMFFELAKEGFVLETHLAATYINMPVKQNSLWVG